MDEELARAIAESMAAESVGTPTELAPMSQGQGGMDEEDDMGRAIMASMTVGGAELATRPPPATAIAPGSGGGGALPPSWSEAFGTGAMDEEAQINAAVMASSQDDMERALMMSMAEAGMGRPQTAEGSRSAPAAVAARFQSAHGGADLGALDGGFAGVSDIGSQNINAMAQQILGGQAGAMHNGVLEPAILSQLMAAAGASGGMLPQHGSLLSGDEQHGVAPAQDAHQREEERNQRQIDEAIQRSLRGRHVGEGGAGDGDDQLAQALAASMADTGDGRGGDGGASAAASMGLSVDSPSAQTPFSSNSAAVGSGAASVVEDDEAEDLRQAMALSLGRDEAAAAATATTAGAGGARRQAGTGSSVLSPRTQRQQAAQHQMRHERWEQDFAYEEGLRADEARAFAEQQVRRAGKPRAGRSLFLPTLPLCSPLPTLWGSTAASLVTQLAPSSQAAAEEVAAAEAGAQKALEQGTSRRAEILRLQKRFGVEPEATTATTAAGGVAELLFELPTGVRLNRRFPMSATCADAVAYVRLLLLRAVVGDDPAAGAPEACLPLLEQGYTLGINFGPQLTGACTINRPLITMHD